MRTSFYLNGKKVSKKYLVEMLGSQRVQGYLEQAKQTAMDDSLVANDFFIGGNQILSIRFEF